MNNYFPYILGIVDTLNDWNEKLNNLIDGKIDNVWVGALIVGVVFIVSAWGINTLSKK